MTEPGQPPPWNQPPPYGSPPPPYGVPPQGYGVEGHGTPPQGYGPPPQGYGPPPGQNEDPVWAILAHLSIFVFALLGPLIIYLIYKDSSPLTRHHAAEALNFHITLTIATIVSIPLVFLFIGIPLVFAIIIGGIVFGIIAAVAASRREPYRYPLTIHFVS